MTEARRKRQYDRQLENAAKALTERDRIILRALHEYGPLYSTHLSWLTETPNQDRLNRRLRQLWDGGFVIRPRVQAKLNFGPGRKPTVYTLGQEGANVLRNAGYDLPAGKGWNYAAESLSDAGNLEHDLGARGAAIWLKRALQKAGYRIDEPSDILARSPADTQRARYPFSIPTRFVWTDDQLYERNIIPDQVFAYRSDRGAVLVFLEYDTGMMEPRRSDPRRTSIMQKVACYSDVFQRNVAKQRFGYDLARTMFVTAGHEQRRNDMVAVCPEFWQRQRERPKAGTFLFSTAAEFYGANTLDAIWQEGDGRTVSLVRSN